MNLPILYIRTCFIFTVIEAFPRLLSAGQNLLQGQAILWALVYLLLYSTMLVLALRVLRNHHVQSAKGLIALRLGLVFSLIVHYGMTRPLPPITILMARELLPAFQLFLACKAKAGIFSLLRSC
ncbi:MAG: hypothetical protein KDK44_01285 [Chlamydiia bacterium]|nr:hypothetical protein [Chlamydiia bacterium]MCP5510005.1 hypothetical protein [Chlamydiales bacterium]